MCSQVFSDFPISVAGMSGHCVNAEEVCERAGDFQPSSPRSLYTHVLTQAPVLGPAATGARGTGW